MVAAGDAVPGLTWHCGDGALGSILAALARDQPAVDAVDNGGPISSGGGSSLTGAVLDVHLNVDDGDSVVASGVTLVDAVCTLKAIIVVSASVACVVPLSTPLQRLQFVIDLLVHATAPDSRASVFCRGQAKHSPEAADVHTLLFASVCRSGSICAGPCAETNGRNPCPRLGDDD